MMAARMDEDFMEANARNVTFWIESRTRLDSSSRTDLSLNARRRFGRQAEGHRPCFVDGRQTFEHSKNHSALVTVAPAATSENAKEPLPKGRANSHCVTYAICEGSIYATESL